jgi:hypothetical protein
MVTKTIRQLADKDGEEAALPKQADITRYIKQLTGLYEEFRYTLPPNNLLDRYYRQHDQDSYCIDVTASGTSLPCSPEAIEKSNKITRAKHVALYGKYDRLVEDKNEIAAKGNWLRSLSGQLAEAEVKGLRHYQVNNLVEYLQQLLSLMDADEIKTARSSVTLHPVVASCIDHCRDGGYFPDVPLDRTEQDRIKTAMVRFMKVCCSQLVDGVPAKPAYESIRKKYARLGSEIEAESARLPSESSQHAMCNDIVENSLKPVVIRNMRELHGFPREIKAANIGICRGSSTHLMDIALKHLTEPAGWSKKKKLLVFSMSWDGLKRMASDAGMQTALIPGPVSAKALDDYIAKHILRGKYTNDPQGAKAEVRKQVGALLVNLPENPLGKLASDHEMTELAVVIAKYDIPLVLSDEIFAAPGHKSLATYPEMENRTYIVSGTSKNLNLPAKISFGYSANNAMAQTVKANIHHEKHLRDVIESLGFSTMLEHTTLDHYQDNQRQYASKRSLIGDVMSQVNARLKLKDGLRWLHTPNYGCLGVISFPKELTDGCGIKSSVQLAEYVYKLAGVMALPIGDVNAAGEPLGIRVNYSYDDDSLTEMVERLGVALDHMKHKKQYNDIAGKKYRGPHAEAETGSQLDELIRGFHIVTEEIDRGKERYDI